jgi:hypothetical protein
VSFCLSCLDKRLSKLIQLRLKRFDNRCKPT